MADLKISELSNAGALDGSESVEVVQGGVNVKTTTQDIADLGGGGGHVIENEGTPLTQRADLNFVGAGVNAADSGGKTVVTIGTEAAYIIDQASASTAGGTITLDMNSQIQRSHVGSASFSGPKTLALSNTTNSLFFNFFFEVTSVLGVITMPSDFLMSTIDFDGSAWTPPNTGLYELGGSFNDTSNMWYVKIAGPFT